MAQTNMEPRCINLFYYCINKCILEQMSVVLWSVKIFKKLISFSVVWWNEKNKLILYISSIIFTFQLWLISWCIFTKPINLGQIYHKVTVQNSSAEIGIQMKKNCIWVWFNSRFLSSFSPALPLSLSAVWEKKTVFLEMKSTPNVLPYLS